MLLHQQTINLGQMRGVVAHIRLRGTEHGYVMVRDADDPEDMPVASQILGPSYTHDLELRPKLLRGVRRLAFFANFADCLDITLQEMGPFWRLARFFRRLRTRFQDLLAMLITGRRSDYAGWHSRFHRMDRQALATLEKSWRQLPARPKILVAIVGGDTEAVTLSLQAVGASVIGIDWCGPASNLSFSGREATGDPIRSLLFLVEAGVRTEPWALALMALRLASEPDDCLVYGDWEAPGKKQKIEPGVTTAFDEVRAHAHPGAQIRGLVAINNFELARGAGISGDFDAMAGKALQAGTSVVHMPAVLSRLPAMPQVSRISHRVSSGQISGGPLVSLIIPSRDNSAMLARTVQTLDARRGETRIEFILVDHASTKPETRQTLARLSQDHPVKVVRAEGDFNFSRLMNLGRAAASGDYLFSINDDIEALEDGWLLPMLAMLNTPGVGAVGPCLLYPDRTIQHAGVIVGYYGYADHVGRRRDWADPDLPALLCQTRSVSAVTGAVLGVSAALWDQVGGWDEELTVEFNDIDFCFKIAASGARVVYCPQSVLIHHESVSRGDPKASRQWPRIKRDRLAFVNANCNALSHDIWYPSSLTLRNTRLRLSAPPRRPHVADLAFAPCEVAPGPLFQSAPVLPARDGISEQN